MRAALDGRVLVLEGMEKAERNVLPVLNNLLENREMQLDDGRLIVAPLRYDQLYQVCACVTRYTFFVLCTYTHVQALNKSSKRVTIFLFLTQITQLIGVLK